VGYLHSFSLDVDVTGIVGIMAEVAALVLQSEGDNHTNSEQNPKREKASGTFPVSQVSGVESQWSVNVPCVGLIPVSGIEHIVVAVVLLISRVVSTRG
jgi:hypothetical protein